MGAEADRARALDAPRLPRVERRTTWSGDEVWHTWPLRWADRTARSLLLAALGIGGLVAAYLLPLLLHRPPALGPGITLRAIGVALLLLATFVAPASRSYRLGAAYCVVLHAVGTAAMVLMVATPLVGPTTYGMLDAVEFATFGALLVAWLLVRMRHPLTILVVVVGYAMAGAAFFSRLLPQLREQLAVDAWAEQRSATDEALTRWVLIALALGLVLLAWWLDGWMRALLPVANVAEPAASDGSGSDGPGREGDRQRLRYAVVTVLLGLDPFAIVLAIAAKQPTAHGRISSDDDWWASIVLAIATARLTLVLVALTAALIWVQNGEFRASF